jgi:cell wall-associated NlpC family hydrolase/type II secretory pathway pseudopilin PulG
MRRPSRTRRVAAVVSVTVLGVLVSALSPVAAQTVDSKRAEAKQIAEKLAELQEEQMELGATYERANYERHLADQKVTEAQAEADATNRELDQRREDLRSFAISAYEGGTEAPTVAAMLSPEATSGAVKQFYIESATGDQGDLIDALKSAELEAEAKADELTAARDDADARVAEIEAARSRAASATAEQQDLNSRVQGELADLVAEEAAAYAARTAAAAEAAAAASSTSTPSPAAPSTAAGATETTRPPARPSTPSAPAPVAPTPAPPSNGSKASGAISAALSKVGSPYVWGAAGPGSFDCSGLVAWAYAQVGVSLPHYSGAQYNVTTRISASQLQPGDLVFWGGGGSEHVAIYMGGNQLVHAFSSNRAVGVTALNGWWKAPSGYGRLNL